METTPLTACKFPFLYLQKLPDTFSPSSQKKNPPLATIPVILSFIHPILSQCHLISHSPHTQTNFHIPIPFSSSLIRRFLPRHSHPTSPPPPPILVVVQSPLLSNRPPTLALPFHPEPRCPPCPPSFPSPCSHPPRSSLRLSSTPLSHSCSPQRSPISACFRPTRPSTRQFPILPHSPLFCCCSRPFRHAPPRPHPAAPISRPFCSPFF